MNSCLRKITPRVRISWTLSSFEELWFASHKTTASDDRSTRPCCKLSIAIIDHRHAFLKTHWAEMPSFAVLLSVYLNHRQTHIREQHCSCCSERPTWPAIRHSRQRAICKRHLKNRFCRQSVASPETNLLSSTFPNKASKFFIVFGVLPYGGHGSLLLLLLYA